MKKIIDWVNFDADYPEVDEFSDEYDEYECDEVDQNAVDRAVEPGDSTSKTAIILSGESLSGCTHLHRIVRARNLWAFFVFR